MCENKKMNQILGQLRLLLVAGLVAGSAAAECNVCNTVNNMACYSVNQTQACDASSNLPTYVPYDCPSGYVCVSGTAGVLCEPESNTTVATCEQCNKCDANNTFACTGTSTFALCEGTTTPLADSSYSCPSGYVCNVNSEYICLPSSSAAPSCSYADDTSNNTIAVTTTASTATSTTAATPSTSNAATYCAAVQSQGKFAVGDYTETTCRQYIYCFLLNGNWLGQKYTCPGSTYFSRSTRTCVTDLPSTCYTPTYTTTTTTAAPTTNNPTAWCAKKQTQDSFLVPNTKCRQYIDCFELNGSWLGAKYTCPGSLYFNSVSRLCESTQPSNC